MAYVQEVVVNALIDNIGNEDKPGDAALLKSLQTLKQHGFCSSYSAIMARGFPMGPGKS
jgi:hypothetical protein